MSDFSTNRTGSSKGWIIGAIVVVLVVLYIVFSSGSAPPTGGEATVPDATPSSETAPAAVAPPAPNISE
jgi:hypothetical protein